MEARKINILFLAEGFEEKPYLDKILSFPCISRRYNTRVKNVKGNGNISACFQNEYQNNNYDLILIFCDVDKGIHDYDKIKKQVGKNFDCPSNVDEIFIFVNPVTLQVVLSHFGKVELKEIGKRTNAEKVKKLVGIENYDAKQKQIKTIIDKITYKTYKTMKNNLKTISTNIKDIPSTNFLDFLGYLESDDVSWVNAILKKLSKDDE